jgi:hypothetical protein
MALPASGAISLGQVHTELGQSATTTSSLGDTDVRTLLGVASGAISLSNAYGKSNTATYNVTVTTNTANYNLHNAVVTAGWNGTSVCTVTCTINASVWVYANSNGVYGFATGTFPAGSSVTIINNGLIVGCGGAGGAGGVASSGAGGAGTAGSAGGPALNATVNISITNNGWILGGGGGGGGGGAIAATLTNVGNGQGNVGGSGGGGGGSWQSSAAGAAGATTAINYYTSGFTGSAGGSNTAGAGGASAYVSVQVVMNPVWAANSTVAGATAFCYGGAGGAGGAWTTGGAGGSGYATGTPVTQQWAGGGGAGGAGGYCTVSTGYTITWTATGNRSGTVA